MEDQRAKIDSSETFPSFLVSKYSDYFMLKFSDNTLFAQVSELAVRGLTSLQDHPTVEIRAFVEAKRIQEVFSRAKKPGEATLKVELNIYGSVDDSKAIGDKLCAAKMFLQDPDHGTEDIEYCNPHVIQFPGIEEPAAKSMGHVVIEPKQPSKAVREERENFDNTVSAIYQSLTRFRNLDRMHGGDHIITPLLQ